MFRNKSKICEIQILKIQIASLKATQQTNKQCQRTRNQYWTFKRFGPMEIISDIGKLGFMITVCSKYTEPFSRQKTELLKRMTITSQLSDLSK